MKRPSLAARLLLVTAVAIPATLGATAATSLAADTTTTIEIAASGGADAPSPGYVFLDHKQFSIDTSDGVGTLSGLDDSPFAVDDFLEIDTYTTDPSVSTPVYKHDFSNGCNNTGDAAIPPVKLNLAKGANLLELTLADRCGVDYGNPDLYLTVNSGTITPITTTTDAGKPVSVTNATGGAASNVIVTPDLKGVSWLGDPGGCASQLRKSAKFASIASSACAYLAKAADARPAKSQTSKSWSSLVSGKKYRGLLDLPSADIVCTGGIPDAALLTAKPTWSAGWVRNSLGSSKLVPGEKYKDDKGIFSTEKPAILLTASAVVLTFRTAFRLPALPDQYALTRTNAPFGYLVLQEKVGCNGSFAATVVSSDVPGYVVYQGNKRVAGADQSSGFEAFALTGGSGHKTSGHGELDPHCRIAVIDGKVKVPTKATASQCTTAATKGYLS